MRAKEFIVEYKTEEYNGLRFTTDIKNGQLIVRALDDWGTNELGHVVFNIGDQDELDPQDLEVDDRYQGQGIAKIMYDYVKTLGYEIHRSYDQTPAGAGFWNKHRGEDQRVWEDAQPKKQVVSAIQKVLPVAQEIWFHGSRATGKNRRNSDTDILVVVPDDLVGDQYLAVVRILQKLSSLFNNYDIQPTKSGTNIHRIAQEEGQLLWPNQQALAEDRGQGSAGIILYAEDTGRYGLQQRSDDINDPGMWAAWGGGGESRHVKEDADGQQVLDYIHGTHHEPLTTQLQQAVLSYPRWELRSVPVSSLHIPDQEYDDEEQEPEADPYNRVQVIDPDHAGEYSANFVDRRPIVVDHEGWIIDGNHRAWAAAELLNRPTIRAWVPASQLNELGNAPAEYKPNRKRSRSLFHATVDGQWVDVFFDRSEFNGTLHITFAVNGDYDAPEQPTSASKSTVKILSTVLNVVKKQLPEYMAKARPPAISFTSKQDNRTSLYRKYFVPVIQNILGAKWQHEEYPSMGMTVFHWKPVKKSGVTEAFDQPYDIRWSKGDHGDYDAYAELDDGTGLEIAFLDQQHNSWMVDFFRDNSTEITGEGDAYRVFATVLTAIREFIVKQQPDKLNFSAEKQDDPRGSRASLYDRMIQRYISGTGYNLTKQDYPDGATYTLTRAQQDITEDAGIDFDMQFDDDTGSFATVTARAHGRTLGSVEFFVDGDVLVADQLEVDERYRGQGIAAAMYDYVKSQGYTVEKSDDLTPDGEHFWNKNRGEENVWENFADGKVKGKSRPGRVKRAGASCNGSVTDLRQRAKNSSGEKARMYHWCANMKSGKKK